MRVIAYDREIHSRYAFVRLHDGCGRSRHLYRNGETVQLRRMDGVNVALKSPVLHEVRLPHTWIERIRALTDQNAQADNDFYKSIWNTLNSQGDKK